MRELTRKIGAQINAIRNELENLVQMGIVELDVNYEETEAGKIKKTHTSSRKKKFYRLRTDSVVYPELRALFLKARVLLEKDFVRKISKAGPIQYFVLTGYFVGEGESDVDLFVVGRVNKTKLSAVIKSFEREIGRELNYTVMTPQEYKYRRDLTDMFLYNLLEGPKIVVIDKITERANAATV